MSCHVTVTNPPRVQRVQMLTDIINDNRVRMIVPAYTPPVRFRIEDVSTAASGAITISDIPAPPAGFQSTCNCHGDGGGAHSQLYDLKVVLFPTS